MKASWVPSRPEAAARLRTASIGVVLLPFVSIVAVWIVLCAAFAAGWIVAAVRTSRAEPWEGDPPPQARLRRFAISLQAVVLILLLVIWGLTAAACGLAVVGGYNLALLAALSRAERRDAVIYLRRAGRIRRGPAVAVAVPRAEQQPRRQSFRMLVALAVLVAMLPFVIAAGAFATSGGSSPRTQDGISAAGLHWMARYRVWVNHVYEAPSTCATTLKSRVGPPTDRVLGPAYQLSLTDCLTGTSDLLGQAYAQVLDATLVEVPLPRHVGPSDASHIDPRLAAATIALRKYDVPGYEVRCWSDADWQTIATEMTAFGGKSTADDWGFVDRYDQPQVNLAPEPCRILADYAERHIVPAVGRDEQLLADSVNALTHETEHTNGYEDEDVAECRAVQQMPQVAMALGATARYARELQLLHWNDDYPYEAPKYRTPSCRAGGALDMTPGDGVWP